MKADVSTISSEAVPRQGDPGSTRFFLSLDDDLMRLFGGERVMNVMNTLKVPDDMPIENKMLSSTIEKAQEKVEGINFQRRKSVLEYDDVMNKQREVIYNQRRMVLDGEDLTSTIDKMITDSAQIIAAEFVAGEDKNAWNLRDCASGFYRLANMKTRWIPTV